MGFQFASASNQFLNRTKVVAAVPLTLYCEAMPFQANAHNVALSQGCAGGVGLPYYSLWFYDNGYVYAYKRDYAATNYGTAQSVIPYAANRWNRVAATFDANDTRVWINGRGPGSAGVACSSTFFWDTAYTTIGTLLISGSQNYSFNGRVCYCAAWPVTLSDAQIQALTDGRLIPEEVRPDVLAGFWPGGGRYGRTYNDFSPRRPQVPMTPSNSPTWGSDPWRRSPSRRLVVPASVAVVDIALTCFPASVSLSAVSGSAAVSCVASASPASATVSPVSPGAIVSAVLSGAAANVPLAAVAATISAGVVLSASPGETTVSTVDQSASVWAVLQTTPAEAQASAVGTSANVGAVLTCDHADVQTSTVSQAIAVGAVLAGQPAEVSLQAVSTIIGVGFVLTCQSADIIASAVSGLASVGSSLSGVPAEVSAESIAGLLSVGAALVCVPGDVDASPVATTVIVVSSGPIELTCIPAEVYASAIATAMHVGAVLTGQPINVTVLAIPAVATIQVIVLGPYTVEAGKIFSTGAVAGSVFSTGAEAGQVFSTGAVAGRIK